MKIQILTLVLMIANSEAGFAQACDTAKIQANFLQNCEFAGMQFFDSFGTKTNMDKVNSVCRCVTNHFVVEQNPGLDKAKCETPVKWISGFLKRADSKAACGYFQ